MLSRRDATLDIAKAICIICMVIGHSGCPDYLYRFIYLFHMPCFFFISGWLLKDKYLTDIKKGLLNKVRGSYFPFVKWSLLFLVFHNVFVRLHIYDANTSYTLSEFGGKILRIVAMSGGEQLLGGYWFLISLFWASVVVLVFFFLLKRAGKLTQRSILMGISFILVVAALENLFPIRLPDQFREQTLLAIAFYASGYYFHQFNIDIRRLWQILFLLVPAIVAIFIGMSMQEKGSSVILYFGIALMGSIGIISASNLLSKYRVHRALTYIGDKTLYILTFHFLSFKLLSLLYIHCKGLPIDTLAQFPVLKETNSYMWIIYSTIGIGLSLLIWEVIHRIAALITLKIN